MEAEPRLRRRVTLTVFAAVAFALTGMFASLTVLPLVSEDVSGANGAGAGPAAAIAGTAVAASMLGSLSARQGRRTGLVSGYLVGTVGALLGVAAAVVENLPLLVAAMLLFGGGSASNLLARYAVATVHPEHRRASVVGLVLWAGALGAVAGPRLADPAGRLAVAAGLPELTGAFVMGALGYAIAGLLSATVPLPRNAADHDHVRSRLGASLRAGLAQPRIRVAITAIVVSQFVMVLIMTMTPVFMRGHGHGLGAVGTIMSAHILGMYMLTPAIGWVVDRAGAAPIIVTGLVLIASAAVLSATADQHATVQLGIALWLLGIGWSLGFVASSGLLSQGQGAEAAQLQGSVDSLVYGAATVASVSSGVLVATFSYPALSIVGLGIALATVLAVVLSWDAVPRPAPVEAG